jgi:hypothetical protein
MTNPVNQSTIPAFSPEIQALIAAGAKADIEPAKRVGKLLTPVTPEAIAGHDRYVKGATAGMFLLPSGAEDFVLADPDKGFTFQAVGAFISFNEWPQERGGGAPIEMHPKRPADCHWLKPPTVAKEGYYRENGNPVEKTLNVLMAYGFGAPFGVFFPFRGKSGYKPAHTAMATAGAAKLPGMKDGNIAVCFVHVTAKLIKDGANTYWVPVFGAPIKFGEKGGPDLTQLKRGLELRTRFLETQDTLPWAGEDAAPALPGATAAKRYAEPTLPPEPPSPEDYDGLEDDHHYPDKGAF